MTIGIATPSFAQSNFFDLFFGKPTLEVEWTYESGLFDEGASEIVAYDATTQRAFVTNGNDSAIDVLDVADGSKVGAIDVGSFGSPTSVSVYDGKVAISVDSGTVGVRGNVVFADAATLNFISSVEVGYLPDMVTFTPNGRYVLTANEAEPDDDYTLDPEGSISIIRVRQFTNAQVFEVGFSQFNNRKDELLAAGVRIFGPNATVAQDLEPEYIAVSSNSRFAYVSLQENNAIATVDIRRKRVISVNALGTKDHTRGRNAFDASNRDGEINIQNWPTRGMYQPDSIAVMRFFGKDLILTANEGDARDYAGYSEEGRVNDLVLDSSAFPNASTLQEDENLGRLKTTFANGDTDGDGDVDEIYSYGARSFSIWRNGRRGIQQVYDSGDDFEQITAAMFAADFNSTDDENGSFDNRSDDKGPEPEAIALGRDLFQTYTFVGLERMGGIMLYEVTNPYFPRHIEYTNNRDFSGDAAAGTAGDLAPEGIAFGSRGTTPFVEPVIIVANEISGTTTLYRIKREGGIFSFLFNGD